MALYLFWDDWRLHYKATQYRMCEMSFELTELWIGPLYFEWNEWQ